MRDASRSRRHVIHNRAFETMPRASLKELQSERLHALARYVYERVPFYRQRLDEAGVDPDTVRSLDDLPRLPFTRKSDLRDHYPFGLFAVPQGEVLRIHASSGATGRPTVVGYTGADVELFAEVNATVARDGGRRAGDDAAQRLRLRALHGGPRPPLRRRAAGAHRRPRLRWDDRAPARAARGLPAGPDRRHAELRHDARPGAREPLR